MNKIIILSTIFLMSCASSNYKRRDIYQVRYTVERLYKCPENYALSVNSMKCVKVPVLSVLTVKDINPIKKAVKRAKKTVKIDCTRVFKEVNQCMK